MPPWASLLIGSLLTLAGGAFTAFITTQLTLKRFYAEKWWTLKCEAYSRIIEALHHAADCSAQWSEAEFLEMVTVSGPMLTEAKIKQLSEDFSKARRDLSVAAGVGAYIISNEVARVLTELEALERKVDDGAMSDIYDAKAKIYKEALEKVRSLAKKDLNIK